LTPTTLTFYSLASGLCFCLSIALLVFAHLQRGTLLILRSAQSFLILSVAFFLSSYGPVMPQWVTVVGTNTLLLSASLVLFSGFVAYQHDIPPRFDRFGATLIVLAIPLFAWWGLVEPDGVIRSIVFSLTSAILNGRTAWILLQLLRQRRASIPVMALGVLFGIAALWMLGRAGILLFADPMPIGPRGDNPTSWVTVFWFNILAAAIVAAILALEIQRYKKRRTELTATRQGPALECRRGKLHLLWTLVAVISFTIAAEVGIAYTVLQQREAALLENRIRMTNHALADHSAQVIKQMDILLRAVRGAWERNPSAPELEQFIRSLDFPREVIEDIYVMDADGQIIAPLADRAKGVNFKQRDYHRFHHDRTTDDLFISPVTLGLISGKHLFRVSRKLADREGRFAGIVGIPLKPQAFTNQYSRILLDYDASATLVSSEDRKIRARSPAVEDPKTYEVPLDTSPLWKNLETTPQGSYQSISTIDGVERYFTYQRINDLPLVMVSGFSLTALQRNTLSSIYPIGLGALLALTIIISLAVILTGVIRRREEQESFTAMLTHELKTPLSVIRMALDGAQLQTDSEALINRSIRAMDDVIERCQLAERLNSSLITAILTRIDPTALLHKLRNESLAPERVVLEIAALPECSTDEQLLRTLIANLIDNALKYSRRDASITLRARPETRNGRNGILFVVSNPPGSAGFPDPAQVFQKYYRAPAAHGKTGSGLGLYICEGFARMLGGELRYGPTDDTVKFELWIPN
jgi:signal transduction histidine kinase